MYMYFTTHLNPDQFQQIQHKPHAAECAHKYVTTLPPALVEYIKTKMTVKDIIHLHILTNAMYDEVKKKTKYFAAVKWATLHPEKNKENNKLQQQKSRTNKKLKQQQTISPHVPIQDNIEVRT